MMDSLDQEMQVGHQPTAGGNRPAVGRNRRLLVCVLIVLGVLAVIFALYKIDIVGLIRQDRMDSRFTPQRWVDLEEPRRSSDGEPLPEVDTLRVAIAPVISPEKSRRIYRDFVDYLAVKLRKEPDFLQEGTYERVNELLRYGDCDIALVCTYAFVRAEEEFGLEALVVPQIEGEDTYQSYILVPRSSRATSLLDLRGKRFASANRLSNSGYLFPMVWLQRHGEDARAFFKGNLVITGSHDESVEQVAWEYADGAAVDSLVYKQMVGEYPTIAKKTKIILESPKFGMPPVVVPPQLDRNLKKKLLNVLLNMHNDPRGKGILKGLQIDRFVEPRDDLFESVRENAEFWESRR